MAININNVLSAIDIFFEYNTSSAIKKSLYSSLVQLFLVVTLIFIMYVNMYVNFVYFNGSFLIMQQTINEPSNRVILPAVISRDCDCIATGLSFMYVTLMLIPRQ